MNDKVQSETAVEGSKSLVQTTGALKVDIQKPNEDAFVEMALLVAVLAFLVVVSLQLLGVDLLNAFYRMADDLDSY